MLVHCASHRRRPVKALPVVGLEEPRFPGSICRRRVVDTRLRRQIMFEIELRRRPDLISWRPRNKPMPIYYIADGIRRQFFADHPFEAFRPTTLVEKGDIELREGNGKEWVRLRQRGRNPTVEDAIQFTVNLHETHQMSLSDAYAQAVAQFRALRSEHHIATSIAALEAEELGGSFGRGEIEHAFEKEKRAIATWELLEDVNEQELTSRKRWKMVAEGYAGESQWSRGAEYVRLWQSGVRVDYAPKMTGPVGDQDSFVDEPEDLHEEMRKAVQDDVHVEVNSRANAESSSGVEEQDAADLLTAKELESIIAKLLDAESLAQEAEPSPQEGHL
ncbi:SNF2 superfamily protein [Mycena kentingensis (nom. inval.)]|nr:SNF2 superfamily protein [Mycena kentingensis (nom. inval.)]